MSVETVSPDILLFYPLIFFLGLSIFVSLVSSMFGPSKTKQYRNDLSNMYVSGKIRQIAEKDGIDLRKEFLDFAKITKNKKIDFDALDNTVERELQEQIAGDVVDAKSDK